MKGVSHTVMGKGWKSCKIKDEIHKTLVGWLLDDGIAVPGAEKVTGSMCYLR